MVGGHDADVEAHVAAARPVAAQSTVVRDALRVFEAVRRSLGRRVLRVGPEARWLEAPGAARADLAGRDVLRRILLSLVEAHARRPGQPLTKEDLLAAGWRGERVLPRAGANRVRVALSTLRNLGLRAVLLSRPDGWLLDPAVSVVRDAGR